MRFMSSPLALLVGAGVWNLSGNETPVELGRGGKFCVNSISGDAVIGLAFSSSEGAGLLILVP